MDFLGRQQRPMKGAVSGQGRGGGLHGLTGVLIKSELVQNTGRFGCKSHLNVPLQMAVPFTSTLSFILFS
ncbi:hypothetical protein [Falsihalocynthiibacter arcticus]|uniref:Uncharacterized protein n=1 Tax=Falsihalocynthiibacter arcticus TaxID=1579316 RepID=A0A126V1B3_9RHOB|nr:hypothetical protein [Falsihalocynthiibacter arcticus]AML51489.1 hypothetical protein RC74_09670 [Falsihalocynthiibacter arcticus]